MECGELEFRKAGFVSKANSETTLIVTLVGATQYYGIVAHTMTALIIRTFKVQECYVLSMSIPIQNMEYYLYTGFRESSIYMGRKED